MKYKPGTRVVVTNVPLKAAMFVAAGMPATVLEVDKQYAEAAEDLGLTMVQIGFFLFWWSEDDLGLHQ